MPLIICHDCTTEHSDMAAACPKCGRPTPVKPEETLLTAQPVMMKDRPVFFIFCVALCFIGVGIPLLLVWWIRCKGLSLTVTSKRTIYREGYFSRNTSEVRHADVRNIIVNQGILGRLFGVGALGISSAAQSGVEIAIGGIEKPELIRDIINGLRA